MVLSPPRLPPLLTSVSLQSKNLEDSRLIGNFWPKLFRSTLLGAILILPLVTGRFFHHPREPRRLFSAFLIGHLRKQQEHSRNCLKRSECPDNISPGPQLRQVQLTGDLCEKMKREIIDRKGFGGWKKLDHRLACSFRRTMLSQNKYFRTYRLCRDCCQPRLLPDGHFVDHPHLVLCHMLSQVGNTGIHHFHERGGIQTDSQNQNRKRDHRGQLSHTQIR